MLATFVSIDNAQLSKVLKISKSKLTDAKGDCNYSGNGSNHESDEDEFNKMAPV